jgi:hypothetical protein
MFARIRGSAKPALISLLSLVTTSAGVFSALIQLDEMGGGLGGVERDLLGPHRSGLFLDQVHQAHPEPPHLTRCGHRLCIAVSQTVGKGTYVDGGAVTRRRNYRAFNSAAWRAMMARPRRGAMQGGDDARIEVER